MSDYIKKPEEYKKYMSWMKSRCKQPGLTFDYDDFLNLMRKMIKEGVIGPNCPEGAVGTERPNDPEEESEEMKKYREGVKKTYKGLFQREFPENWNGVTY